MKVLHVINSLSGSGGAEQGLVREITHFDPSVISLVARLFEAKDLEPRLTSHGIDVVSLGMATSKSAWTWPEAARQVRGLVRSFRPDIVHTSLFIGNLVGQLAAARRNPVLSTLTLTGDERLLREYQPGANTRKAALLRAVAGRVGRRQNIRYRAITADTASTNVELMRIDPSRITVIPRGVPLVNAEPDRGRFGIPDGVPLVVNIARQAAQKGQRLLLQAFRKLRVSIPDAHLAIAGREAGATSAIRQEVVDLGLEGSVHLLGYRDDVPVLLASADLFIFSSLAEGLGTAVIEAMAAGVPVVAFDIPPVREVTDGGRHARLVPVGDVESLSAAGIRALSDRSAAQFEAQEWALERFSLRKIAADLQALMESAIEDVSCRRSVAT